MGGKNYHIPLANWKYGISTFITFLRATLTLLNEEMPGEQLMQTECIKISFLFLKIYIPQMEMR